MEKAIPFALAASVCTATSSVCQRLGARNSMPAGFDFWLIFRVGARPIWLLGIASMILGFVFQLGALHYGPLALVQPILALELLFVFGYMAILSSRRVASPAAGRPQRCRRRGLLLSRVAVGAPPLPGCCRPVLACWLAVSVAGGLAFALHHRSAPSAARQSAILGAVTGVSWGFVAAVIKEFSSHLGDGAAAIFSNWSVYVLIGAGAASLLLASHALAAGPLAASQPGFTILDPLAASLLGMFLFNEHVQAGTGPSPWRRWRWG